ncbi:DUF5659 domain-containing protein [Tissierella sp.]|uniref:DUF5659 domain-containing protein n=1 Tax=Tissierella sp. TaxID=41274 RepID=UPI0028AC8280|nr:DUF5659 domain-containing protein [Tissierella sp.]
MEEKREKAELYFVTSLYLNAWLLSQGFEMIKTAKLDNNKVALFYVNTDELNNAIKEYRQNNELKEFVSQLKNVQEIVRMHIQREKVSETLEIPFD